MKLNVNKMDVSFSNPALMGSLSMVQVAENFKSLDPKDESLICEVECASKADVDKACKAAHGLSRMVNGVR